LENPQWVVFRRPMAANNLPMAKAGASTPPADIPNRRMGSILRIGLPPYYGHSRPPLEGECPFD
jgi:hypothetical protein